MENEVGASEEWSNGEQVLVLVLETAFHVIDRSSRYRGD